MTKLIINFLILILISSCQLKDMKKFNPNLEIDKNTTNQLNVPLQLEKDIPIYVLGEPYYIEGVKYVPEENYNYNQVGLATFYNKELHNQKTINNDYNKVTELLGRHKTLPIPSIVKITNLENGLSLTIKIIDRHEDNSAIIQVSRKSSQLLKFYKNKIARVRIEILSDPSKQMKIVTQSMNESSFNETINSAPTGIVSITDIAKDFNPAIVINNQETAINLGFSEVTKQKMYLRVFGFKSYNEAKSVFNELKIKKKFTTQNDQSSYSIIIGPLENQEANNLVLSFISRGYKETQFFIE